MTTQSRQRALDALGIRRWSRRDAVRRERDAVGAASSPTPGPASVQAQLSESDQMAHGPAPTLEAAVVAPAGDAAAATATAVDRDAAAPYEPPHDWAALREAVADCRRCGLCETRQHTVFGVGPENAPLMVIGEGPGAEEDKQGEPFVGRAGKLLDQMLKAIGRSRQDGVFIANVVKCRPPSNRDPRAEEVAACRPYLDRQIELIQPRLIVGLGRVAAQRLLDTKLPMSKLRGSVHQYGPHATPVMLTYHPAYLLRSPREKAKAWQDLKAIARFLAAGSASETTP